MTSAIFMKNELLFLVMNEKNIGFVPPMMFQLSVILQLCFWLLLMHISYYSLAFRIKQLTLYLQENQELTESGVEHDQENDDNIQVAKSNSLDKR